MWLVGRATPGLPSHPIYCVVRTTSLGIFCAELKFNYSWVFSLSTIQCNCQWLSAPSSSTEDLSRVFISAGERSVLPPRPLGLCFLKSLCSCVRWFVCFWWADAWYFNCGLNRYIMQIYLWCSLPSIYWQKAFMILLSRNQCQIKQLKAAWSCVSICLLKKNSLRFK